MPDTILGPDSARRRVNPLNRATCQPCAQLRVELLSLDDGFLAAHRPVASPVNQPRSGRRSAPRNTFEPNVDQSC
jgi:hypothetical protein